MGSFEQPPLNTTEQQESREEPVEYLYHQVPTKLKGNTLYPLNELKTMYPDIYQAEVAKYQGREQLMEEQIPLGDAQWNDVIHLTAVHPAKVKEALVEAGMTDLPEMEWYQIPISLLQVDNSIIWSGHFEDEPNDQFRQFNEEALQQAAKIPVETQEYYQEEISQGHRPLMFKYIPHIFYKGSIPLEQCQKITV